LDIWPTPIIFLHQTRAHGSTQANIIEVSSFLGGDTVPQIVQFLTFWRSIVPSSTWLCRPRRVAMQVNPLAPSDPYMGRTAQLTSRHCILNTCSTNIHTEYFKCAAYSPFFSLQNAGYFIILTRLVPVLFTF
jgi:hypothetical protein